MLRLPKPPKNARIAVTAPASKVDSTRLQQGIKWLQQQGYEVVVGDTCYSQYHYFSAPDQQRADELMHFFERDDIDAIICARGGFGTIRLLPLLDYSLIAKHPKPLVGYSDITALSWALLAKAGLPTINGSMVAADFGDPKSTPQNLEQFLQLFRSGNLQLSIPKTSTKTTLKSSLKGFLLPGTLSVLSSLLHTPYAPPLDGALLLIEDVTEPSRKIDGYLQHLGLSGLLSRLEALLIGDFADRAKADEADYPAALFLDPIAQQQIPLISGWPFGHIPDKRSFPVGIECRIQEGKDDYLMESLYSIYQD